MVSLLSDETHQLDEYVLDKEVGEDNKYHRYNSCGDEVQKPRCAKFVQSDAKFWNYPKSMQ